MKIKTTKQMRLDELIKYVWENDIRNRQFDGYNPNHPFKAKDAAFFVDSTGELNLSGDLYEQIIFEPTVEEELTEETEFKELVVTKENKARGTTMAWNCTIDDLSDDAEKSAVYAQVNGDLILIWSKYTGIPTEGVIEA